MKYLYILLYSFLILTLSACGGGSGGGNGRTDTITIDMSPLRVVGFSDDGLGSPLHPVVFFGDIPNGETLLMRVRDPYGMGDFYSIQILSNGFGGSSSGTPTVDEGEPDNSPIDAATLTSGLFLDRGLNPLLDEDWFTFTSSGECCNFIFTASNSSGSAADPILEVYDPTPNLGPVTYTGKTTASKVTLVEGVFDPVNSRTLITMVMLGIEGLMPFDINSFFLVFDGSTTPGDYPIRFAGPPSPSDAPGSVTGSVHIDRYNDVGGRIIGSFDITIFDVSRSTTVAGSFDVTRQPDGAGLLTGFRPGSPRNNSLSVTGKLKNISAYMQRNR